MFQQMWTHENRKYLICVDSYEDRELKGWFFTPCQEAERFSSLSQFLMKMEDSLERVQMPQSYTALRRFSEPQWDGSVLDSPLPRGVEATFELKILFRQHSSWQGVLVWREKKAEHSFRSVLELILLLDSALRDAEGSGAA